MDNLIEYLVAIETDAQDAMHVMVKETAELTRKAQESLAEKIAHIEQNTIHAIRQIEREADLDAARKITEIHEAYAHKWQTLENHFNVNKNELVEKITKEVLQGTS
ncbi:MAG: hypothetical protein FWE05_00285 [Defluviitaleaceae bacterium]|nr:hypothetical protein [Defluviitaleaceae bacterium]